LTPARRFAEGTDVPVSKTRGEIEALLTKHGAAQILSGIDTQQRTGFVGFTLHGRQYRIPLVARKDPRRKPDQLEREQWRALLLIMKGKLEFVAGGLSTHDQEFLAHLVLPNGETVGQYIAPRLAEAYENGSMRPLLPAWSGP
jgi:hypothetical protein